MVSETKALQVHAPLPTSPQLSVQARVADSTGSAWLVLSDEDEIEERPDSPQHELPAQDLLSVHHGLALKRPGMSS